LRRNIRHLWYYIKNTTSSPSSVTPSTPVLKGDSTETAHLVQECLQTPATNGEVQKKRNCGKNDENMDRECGCYLKHQGIHHGYLLQSETFTIQPVDADPEHPGLHGHYPTTDTAPNPLTFLSGTFGGSSAGSPIPPLITATEFRLHAVLTEHTYPPTVVRGRTIAHSQQGDTMNTNILKERESDKNLSDAIAKGALLWAPVCAVAVASLVQFLAPSDDLETMRFSDLLLKALLIFSPLCIAEEATRWMLTAKRPFLNAVGFKKELPPKLPHFIPPGLKRH
jgi:hypothetical protein